MAPTWHTVPSVHSTPRPIAAQGHCTAAGAFRLRLYLPIAPTDPPCSESALRALVALETANGIPGPRTQFILEAHLKGANRGSGVPGTRACCPRYPIMSAAAAGISRQQTLSRVRSSARLVLRNDEKSARAFDSYLEACNFRYVPRREACREARARRLAARPARGRGARRHRARAAWREVRKARPWSRSHSRTTLPKQQ